MQKESKVVFESAEAKEIAVPGPVPNTRLTEQYVRMVARETYFWAWPMANIYNKRLVFKQLPEPGLMNGMLPAAPLNRLAMLCDYVEPEERWVACPNQDVIYGASLCGLDEGPVVVQVPDFGKRFWVYQIIDLRTDSIAELGAMYGTAPGFYMVVGPDWKDEVPNGIRRAFQSTTNTIMIAPRVFQSDEPEDKKAVQSIINQINVYPLEEFNEKIQSMDWSKLPKFPQSGDKSSEETKWVFPEKIIEQLYDILDDAPPLPGEEARYRQTYFLLDELQRNPELKKAAIDEFIKTDTDVVAPLLQFRNFGIPLPHYWTTQNNGAQFGIDYFTRTAVAKSNILVNKPSETKYFYQDLDETGTRLNGSFNYTVTFAKDTIPPARGFWSLTLYDSHHFFVPNSIKRYSLGTKNKDLQLNADGALIIYVQPNPPPGNESNWLPSPKGKNFSLYIRAYWPEEAILNGKWTPPPVAIKE